MKKLGIIQPGRLGDIIICLPIAKWYADKGYEVIWPIGNGYVSNFAGYIDYVTFVGIGSLDCNEARSVVVTKCNTLIDLSITFPNSHPGNDEFFFANRSKMHFDEIKYLFANVPFEEKWNLHFTRNHKNELDLYNSLNLKDEAYTFVHNRGSSESFQYQAAPGERVVIAHEAMPSIFDWMYVIERASKIVCIDSCFANLIEQSYSGLCEKFLVRRAADVRPVYKDWVIL
jgi:hypothetical protein